MRPPLPPTGPIERRPARGPAATRLASCGLALALLACSPDAAPPADDADTGARPPAAAPTAGPAPEAEGSGSPTATFDEDGGWILSAEGVGPLRFGMDLEELRPHLANPDATFDLRGECAYARVAGAPAGLELMVVEGRLVRAEVLAGRTRTASGIRVGDAEERVRDAHGVPTDALRERPRKYTAGRTLIAMPGFPGDTLHRLVFETDGRQVTEFRGGLHPQVEWVEGCG
jgi:hypothetical protein